jgi:hypothetical protein
MFSKKRGKYFEKTGKSIIFSVAIVVSTCFEFLFSSSSPYLKKTTKICNGGQMASLHF